MAAYSTTQRYLVNRIRSSSFQENKTMEEAWVDARYNPEIDPLPLRGKVSLLGTSYFLPQGKDVLFEGFHCILLCLTACLRGGRI